ncbi:DUF3298 domain-containing protein [Devosia nitrariae]|uniref:DUF3298 domain-containing protein n=1 Tax=Devosia nitrariae TaxID=2071872 RepID=A0ABQ5WAJ9_9HYPH|nr:DUF3298 domain-containing protein [Devosia nitrariae]GLQ57099.1 hypothetical protein GCM10010862_43580 [Devosia nitrariae]
MRIVFAILAVFALALPHTAAAASFDCAKAATVMEETICDVPDLSKADEVLDVAYATAIGGLSKSAVNEMRQGQRDWLDFAGYVCIKEAPDDTLEERGTCLLDLYNQRISTLEDSRMLGGRRFYLHTAYGAAPDPEAEPGSYWQVAQHALAFPMIDGEDDVAKGFNDMMGVYFAEWVLDGESDDFDSSSDITMSASVETVLPARITVKLDNFWYGHGAAHGNYGVSYLHYLPAENRQMIAQDLFAGSDWQKTLLDLTVAALKSEHGDALFDGFEDDIAEIVTNPERWIFGDYGLSIQFQPYEVSAYAYGAPTATVKWENLDGLLSESGQTLRWGS